MQQDFKMKAVKNETIRVKVRVIHVLCHLSGKTPSNTRRRNVSFRFRGCLPQGQEFRVG